MRGIGFRAESSIFLQLKIGIATAVYFACKTKKKQDFSQKLGINCLLRTNVLRQRSAGTSSFVVVFPSFYLPIPLVGQSLLHAKLTVAAACTIWPWPIQKSPSIDFA